MTEENFRPVEKLLGRFAEQLGSELRGEIREQVGRLDAKIEEQGMALRREIAAQSEDLERWFGVQREAFQRDLAVVGEGHQMLVEKIDRLADEVRARSDHLERELLAHKADPHAHQGWRVGGRDPLDG